jgi:hypothetical protein
MGIGLVFPRSVSLCGKVSVITDAAINNNAKAVSHGSARDSHALIFIFWRHSNDKSR